MSNRPQDYQEHYQDDEFWSKAKKLAASVGRKVLEPALKLYYAAQDPDTPAWAKAVIYGALGYFILPLDAVPDALPGVGFTDDIAVMVAALGTVAAHIKDEHAVKAGEVISRWLGQEQE